MKMGAELPSTEQLFTEISVWCPIYLRRESSHTTQLQKRYKSLIIFQAAHTMISDSDL